MEYNELFKEKIVAGKSLFSLEWNSELDTYSIKHISDLYVDNLEEFWRGENHGNCTLGFFESENEARAWIEMTSKTHRDLNLPIDMAYFVLEGEPIKKELQISTVETVLRQNNLGHANKISSGWIILAIFEDRASVESYKSIIELYRPAS